MKIALNFNPTFNPTSKTLDFSGLSGFNIKNLFAVINITRNQIIYAAGQSSLGTSNIAGSIITLVFDTTSHNSGDVLMVLYDVIDLGQASDSVATTDSGSFSLISLFKRLLQKMPQLGQNTMSQSQAVAIASDQSSIPVQTTFDGLLERLVLKAVSRLTYASTGELRTQFTNTLPTGTNSIGTVGINANQIVAIAGSTTNGASQLLAQQCYQQSFRRNLA